ncbi:MAG: FAD-containing oxidoreductase [Acetobacteraceae bacterium]|nr:FAD-containing oxidoreductase [Acetobacteraceae bacterium]
MSKRYDAIIIGAGQAGPPLAGRLTKAGMTVAVIERKLFGGTCVNTGCMPTKALVASAFAAHLARRAADYGVLLSGGVSIDMQAVNARKDAITLRSRTGIRDWLRSMERCTVYEDHARFTGPHEIAVSGETISAERIFINAGGRAIVPDMPGIDQVHYLTNTSVLQLDAVPRHLVIIGGSYIGLEFAQIYRRFGSDVTVVEKGPRLIAREDEDASSAVKDILEREGIAIRLHAECIRFARNGDKIEVGVDCTSGPPEISGSHALLAVGRRPNTDDLGLERAGIVTDAHGYISVDDELRTSVPGVWAIGDCNGRGAFTHTSYNDFQIVAANLLDGGKRRVSDRIETYALYTDPPLGRAGLTETAARASGRKVRVGMRPMTKVGRAIEKGETLGFMKIVVDAESKAILGAAIFGVGGDEAIHGILDTMSAGAPYTALEQTMHIHPTVSELIPTLLDELGP